MIVPIVIIVVCATAVLANVSGVFELADYSIKIGDAAVTLQTPIYENEDRVYVSLRSICDELGIPISWDGEKREVTMDVNNKRVQVSDKTSFKDEGVIPDEETALAVGKAILEKYAGKPMEYETDRTIYFLRTEYLVEKNAWRIIQNFKFQPGIIGGIDGGDFASVELSKNTGEVMYINTHSTYTD